MKNFSFLIILLMNSILTVGQTPFTTLLKEPRIIAVKKVDGKEIYRAVNDTLTTYQFFNKPDELAANLLSADSVNVDSYRTSDKKEILFFKNNNFALNLANEGENRVSLNSEVVHYKLYVINPNEQNTYRYNKYNIPLLLISKISTSSDTISKSSAYDILDYNGSPLTLRIMPSWKFQFKNLNDLIYLGLYSDLRGIQTDSNKLNLEYLWSSGFGFTYQGDSEGAKVTENGDYIQGKYSISIMYQYATGNDKIIQSLFNTTEKSVSALQGFFIIKLGNDNPLNLRVGYQYYFSEILNGSKSNLSIALGI